MKKQINLSRSFDQPAPVFPGLLLILLLFVFPACSDNGGTEKKEHVWSDQTRAMEKAKEVEGMVQESVELQARDIEEQTR